MTLPITPDSLTAAYEYLRTTPPFKSWRLPHADAVEFHVTRHRDREADHRVYCKTRADMTLRHIIRVSAYHITTTAKLMEAVGHEMIHMHQAVMGNKVQHSPQFNRWNARMCEVHGWAVVGFV